MKMNASIKIIVKSTIENVRLVGLTVKSISSLQFTSKRQCIRMETAIVEALTNVVKHAYQNQPDRTIEMIIDIRDDQICFTIIDDGLSFNPDKLSGHTVDPDNLPENGMGIHIYCTIMDDVHYSTSKSKNTLKLVKHKIKNR